MQDIQGLSPKRVKQPIKSRSRINNVCLLTGAICQPGRHEAELEMGHQVRDLGWVRSVGSKVITVVLYQIDPIFKNLESIFDAFMT